MDTSAFCVYNAARSVVVSSKVTLADSANQPLTILKVLVGGLALDSESGLWLSPVHGVPSIPRLFPFDLLYLDHELRILDQTEFVPGAEFPKYCQEVTSALVLPSQTLRTTQTEPGDRLIICSAKEMERQISILDAGEYVLASSIPMPDHHRGDIVASHVESAPRQTSGSPIAVPVGIGAVVAVTEELENGSRSHASGPLTVLDVEETWPRNGAMADQSAITIGEEHDQGEVPKIGFAVVESEPIAASTLIEAPKESSANGGRSRFQSNSPVMSITEVILERPRTEEPSMIGGLRGEDSFANWMEKPTLASASKVGSEPVKQQMDAPLAPPVVDVPDPEPVPTAAMLNAEGVSASDSSVAQVETSEGKTESRTEPLAEPQIEPTVAAAPVNPVEASANQSESLPLPVPQADSKPAEKETPGDAQPPGTELEPTKSGSSNSEPLLAASAAPVVNPMRVAFPRPGQATTSTVAHYGLWRASLPTAVIAVAAQKEPAQARPEGSSANATTNGAMKGSPDTKIEEPKASGTKSHAVDAMPATPDNSVMAGTPTQPSRERQQVGPSAETTRVPATDAVDIVQRKLGIGQANVSEGVVSVTDEVAEPLPVKKVRSSASPEPVQNLANVAPARNEQPASRGNGSPTLIEARSAAPNGKPKTPAARVEANGKTSGSPPTLAARFRHWLNPAIPASSDRRRAHRRYVPGMVAHYYTGGAPKPHEVADISMTGFYLLTEDRWMPDTMIQMTLQKPCAKGERKQSITVLSKIVRRGSDGVAAQFVMAESLDPYSHDVQPSQTTDKFALARFI